MSHTRRNFIKIMGSSAVIMAATGAGITTFALTRTPETALKPWELAGGNNYKDPRMRALSYGVLAPNPHNRQPWMVDLKTEGEITLYCDLDRLLPATDPFDRQITIGLGCFLELTQIAASQDGYSANIQPFPEGFNDKNLDKRPIARIKFQKSDDKKADPLFDQIPNRRSNKSPFDTTRPVPADILKTITNAGRTNVTAKSRNDDAFLTQMRDLTWRAMELEIKTPYTFQESVDLMRIGKAEINANPDGLNLRGPFLEGLNALGLLTREGMADPSSSSFQQGLDMFIPIMNSAMAYLWITTPGNSRIDQINVGRSYVRHNLKATELGLAYHPISQTLQEYPEMSGLFDELHETVQAGSARVQMLVRLGYGENIDPSPRWPLDTKVQS